MRHFGWAETKLIPEVLFFQEGPGVRKWQFRESGVKLLNGRNINDNALDLSTTSVYLSEDEANGKYSHFLAEEGDFVIACSGITIEKFDKKSAFVKKEHLPLCMNTSTMRFKSLNENVLDIRFFNYYIRSNAFLSQLQRLITGSAQLNFGPSHVKKIAIPLPPLEEQKRIAGILDEADRVRKKTQALIDKYDELAQSLFLDMFGDLFSDSTIPLGDLVEFSQGIQIGIENQRLQPEEGFERFLRIIDFTQGDDLRFVPQVDEKYRVKHDDIVMVRYGTVGFVGTNKEGVLANNLFKINYDRKRFNQMFLFHVFQHARFKRFIEKEAYGATMPALSFKVMRTYDIPCPSLKMQNLFAEQIGFIDGLKGTASNSLSNSAKLFNALLQKAFKGELT